MTTAASVPTRKTNWLANVGLAIMVVAFAWLFLFYAQWTGPLRLLDLKVPCLVTTIDECSFFHSRLDDFHAAGPVYQPAVWGIRMATFLSGRVSGGLFPRKPPAAGGLGRRGPKDG